MIMRLETGYLSVHLYNQKNKEEKEKEKKKKGNIMKRQEKHSK
jgi:hypothetical protein